MSDNVDNFLAHYGVRGMKWGQRRADIKAERKATAESARALGYTERQRQKDFNDMGAKGVRKVEARVAGGESVNVARFKEQSKNTAAGLAFAAAIIGGPIALGAASRSLSSLSGTINAKRGAAAAATMLADSRGLTPYSTFGMTLNAATGTWR